MKFFMIHLMPYSDLDLDYDKKHDSAWVTLPNAYFDPAKGPAMYNRYMDELVYAMNGLRRHLLQRASPERLWPDADPRRHRRRARAPDQELQDRGSRPRAAAAELSAGGRRRIRHARQHLERPADAGFVRGIGAEYHSTGSNPAESHAASTKRTT